MCYNAITGSAPSYLSELLHLYSPSHSLRSSSDTCTLKIQRFNRKTPMAFALSHTLAPTSGTISPKTSGALLLSLPSKSTQDISLLRIFQLNHIVLHSHQSVQCVCVCVRACIICITILEHLSIYTFKNKTFSISMYIMCVCLFSALSRRVGALQISIIISIKKMGKHGRFIVWGKKRNVLRLGLKECREGFFWRRMGRSFHTE